MGASVLIMLRQPCVFGRPLSSRLGVFLPRISTYCRCSRGSRAEVFIMNDIFGKAGSVDVGQAVVSHTLDSVQV